MSESSGPTERSADREVRIAVVRTGGIAGLRRQWQVEPDPDDAAHWLALVERCPWDQETDDGQSADRFVWMIRVHTPDVRRERELSDSALDGPWRALVEAVRDAAG